MITESSSARRPRKEDLRHPHTSGRHLVKGNKTVGRQRERYEERETVQMKQFVSNILEIPVKRGGFNIALESPQTLYLARNCVSHEWRKVKPVESVNTGHSTLLASDICKYGKPILRITIDETEVQRTGDYGCRPNSTREKSKFKMRNGRCWVKQSKEREGKNDFVPSDSSRKLYYWGKGQGKGPQQQNKGRKRHPGRRLAGQKRNTMRCRGQKKKKETTRMIERSQKKNGYRVPGRASIFSFWFRKSRVQSLLSANIKRGEQYVSVFFFYVGSGPPQKQRQAILRTVKTTVPARRRMRVCTEGGTRAVGLLWDGEEM